MESEGREVVQLELKYCERCGGLWIRALNSAIIYCAPCAIEMAQVAIPRRRNSKAGKVSAPSIERPHQLTLVRAEAGTA